MQRLLLAVTAVLIGSSILAAAAHGAAPPPGAHMSNSLRYETRVPASAGIVEGKIDRVGGREVLVTTGKYGFKTYDLSDPTNPQLLDTFQPPEVLGANGYWQDEIGRASCRERV